MILSPFQLRVAVRPSVVLVVIPVLALLIYLGLWQLEREAEKLAIKDNYETRIDQPPIVLGAEPVDAQDFEYYRATVTGTYRPEHQILIDNQIRHGRPGFRVITPLALSGTVMHVLVDRGWIPWEADRTVMPRIDTPQGELTLFGLLKRPSDDFFTLERGRPEADQLVWQNLDLKHYRELKDFPLQDLIVLLSPESDAGGFERDWPSYTDSWIARHRGYALTWFGFAIILSIGVVALAVRGTRRRAPSSRPESIP